MLYRKLFDGTCVPAIWQGGSHVTRASVEEQTKLWIAGIELGSFAIDTSEIYGRGRSENIVGEVLKRVQRSSVFVATKADVQHLQYSGIIEACERSLKRLGTEYIDLYQIHWPNPLVPLEETMRAMMVLRDGGKIRHIGVCNCTLSQIRLCNDFLSGELATVQTEYNLVTRTWERDVLPYCVKHGILPLAYSPLNDGGFRAHAILVTLAKKYSKTPEQITLNWITAKNSVCALVRTGSSAHSVENAQAVDFVLSDDDYDVISDEFRETIIKLKPSDISCKHTLFGVEGKGSAYQTVDAARENARGLFPSSLDLSNEISITGELLKPLIVDYRDGRYELVNGSVRYWAWVIAFGMETEVECIILKGV